MRGGAWDEFGNNCRSAKRMGFGVSPFLKDFILGFRVVLPHHAALIALTWLLGVGQRLHLVPRRLLPVGAAVQVLVQDMLRNREDDPDIASRSGFAASDRDDLSTDQVGTVGASERRRM